MGNRAAAVAGGIAAIHRAKDATTRWRIGHRLAGVLQTFFRRRREHSEIGGFRGSGSGTKYDFANPAEAVQSVGMLGVRTPREEERAAQGSAFACLLPGGLSAADCRAPDDGAAQEH